MAKELRLLYVLWIVVAVFATASGLTETEIAEGETEATSGATASTSISGATASTSISGATASTSIGGATLSTTITAPTPDVSLTTATSATNNTNATDALTTEGPATTATSPTTQPPNPCNSNTCGPGSTCEARANQNFVCLCLPGDRYNNETKTCNRARVFPGQLVFGSKDFEQAMSDKTSQTFQDTANDITSEIDKALSGAGYVGSIVLELRPLSMRETSPGVNATVEMAFEESHEITKDDVKDKMEAIPDATFTARELCGESPCDDQTSECKENGGIFSCSCLAGHITTNFTDRTCIACVDKKEVNGICVSCSFGYSGFNCQDNWLYLLTIIGSVLGGLLLITLIVLLVVALKSPKKSSKKSKNEDIGKPYISHSAAKAPLANGSYSNGAVGGPANGLSANVGVPRIPRATSTNAWGSRSNLEMTPTNSRQNLIATGTNLRLNDDRDDMFSYSQTRPQTNPYAQSRPQNNSYAQNRANFNPYA